jgi:hypothetical protein
MAIINPEHESNIRYISDKVFPFVSGGTVLELGSFDGAWFTVPLIEKAQAVTCVELNTIACNTIQRNLGDCITLIKDDFHEAVRTVGYFDSVVLFGILYHSCAPLKLLEDIVNFIGPKFILLEANTLVANNHRGILVESEMEVNQVGMRQAKQKVSKLVIRLSMDIYREAMINLDYEEVYTMDMRDAVLTSPFKDQFAYSVFRRKDN